ncbi:MAG: hypothetical protein HY080_16880 [Gammaproteobacteria bacterium]|nr:hypothetical protein [Gammaproteobacteria bacterium]
MTRPTQTHPRRVTVFVILIIGLACVLMATLMAPGLPSNPRLADRIHFIEQHTLVWQWSWLSWTLSSFALLWFSILLLDYIPTTAAKFLGIVLIALGIIPDLLAQLLYSQLLPQLTADPRGYQFTETIAQWLTGVLANGLYCSGGLLLNLLLLRNRSLPRWPIYSGLPAWCFGIGLSVAISGGHYILATLLTALSMSWSLAWMAVVAWKLWRLNTHYEMYTHVI